MSGSEPSRVLLVGASGRVGRMVLHHWHRIGSALGCVPQFRNREVRGSLVWDPMIGPKPLLDLINTSGGFGSMIMLGGVTPGLNAPLALNTALAEACLSAAVAADIPRVLLASSSAVYGAGDGSHFSETSPCNPINDYGVAKLDMERASAQWHRSDLDLCLLRIGNVAGADALLLNAAKAAPGQTIEIDIFDDGRGPVRSYIGVRTLAQVLQTLCLHPASLPAVLNIGTPEPVSMDALADAAGQPWRARIAASQSPQNITLDCSLLTSLHSFAPQDSDPANMVQQLKESAQK